MTNFSYFRVYAYNNAWANYRLLTACQELTDEALNAQRINFFPTIIHTLNHNLTVDWFYVSAMEGASIGFDAFDPEIPCPKFTDIINEQRAVDRRLIEICEDLDDDELAAPIDIVRDTWTQSEHLDRTLLHLFQHQIHHRGQVHSMLTNTDVAPPQLDEFFLGHDIEIALRKKDFADLNFNEDEIWRKT